MRRFKGDWDLIGVLLELGLVMWRIIITLIISINITGITRL